MRVVVVKQDLSKAVSLLYKITDKRAIYKPVAWFKLKATDCFVVEAKNDEMHLRMNIPADVWEEGEVCVQAGVFLKIVQSSKSKILELRTEGDKLVIDGNDVIDEISIKPVEDFPEFPKCDYRYSLPVNKLEESVEKVGFAVGDDKSCRANPLNHLLIHGRGEYLNIVGCDGYRLAVFKVDIPFSETIYIYNQALKVLPNLLKTAKGDVKIGVCEDREKFVCLAGKNFELAVRVDVGYDYPDYESAIPSGCNTLIELYAGDLRRVLESFVWEPKVIFELTESSEGFRVKSKDHFNNEIEAWVRGRVVGKDLTVAFKPKHLLDFLKDINHYIQIELTDEESPAVFVANKNYLYVVMPVLLNS